MRTKLVEEQAGAKAAVIDATETLQYQITQLAMQEEDLASLTAGLAVIARDSEKAVQSFSPTTPRSSTTRSGGPRTSSSASPRPRPRSTT